MQDDRTVRPRIHPGGGRRGHEGGHLLWTELVLDVVHTQSGVLVSGEDQVLTDKTARPIFMNIVRSKMTADFEIILVRRLGEGRDADRIGLDLVVEDPDRL